MDITENNALVIEPYHLIGKSTAVLGITGSGKTNTVVVLNYASC